MSANNLTDFVCGYLLQLIITFFHVVPKTAGKKVGRQQTTFSQHSSKHIWLKPIKSHQNGTLQHWSSVCISSGRLVDWLPKRSRGCHGNSCSASEFSLWMGVPSKSFGYIVSACCRKYFTTFFLFRQYLALNCSAKTIQNGCLLR